MQGTEGQGVERPALRAPRRAVMPRRRIAETALDAGGMAIALDCALPDGVEGATFPGPEALDAVLLATLGATRVFCPLVAGDFDALAVAARLAKIGYTGWLVVICPELPNPRMVEREIRHQGPGMKVELRLPA